MYRLGDNNFGYTAATMVFFVCVCVTKYVVSVASGTEPCSSCDRSARSQRLFEYVANYRSTAIICLRIASGVSETRKATP